MPHSHWESFIGEIRLPTLYMCWKSISWMLCPHKHKVQLLYWKPVQHLSHIQKVIFPEAGEVPPNPVRLDQRRPTLSESGIGGYWKGPVFSRRLLWMRRRQIVHKKKKNQWTEPRMQVRLTDQPLKNEQITDLPDSPRSKHRKGFEMTHIIVRPLQTNVQGGEGTRLLDTEQSQHSLPKWKTQVTN